MIQLYIFWVALWQEGMRVSLEEMYGHPSP
jgi:hypothetical protein